MHWDRCFDGPDGLGARQRHLPSLCGEFEVRACSPASLPQPGGSGRTTVFDYMEGFYKRVRRHSSLGYLSPAEYEQATMEAMKEVAVAYAKTVRDLGVSPLRSTAVDCAQCPSAIRAYL
jgi:hypothetical protein